MAHQVTTFEGTCKWFNSKKGFGFIAPNDGSDDVFVHQSELYAEGNRSLAKGEELVFEITMSKDGRRTAKNVTGPNGDYVKGDPKTQSESVKNETKSGNRNRNTNETGTNESKSKNDDVTEATVATVDENIDFFDKLRNNSFFIEWRVEDNKICKEMDKLQKDLLKIGGDLQILQSCASDNIHITMNELKLSNNEELEIALSVIKDFENDKLFSSYMKDTISLTHFGNFNNKVLYINAVGMKDKDVLVTIYQDLKKRFVDAGLTHKGGGAGGAGGGGADTGGGDDSKKGKGKGKGKSKKSKQPKEKAFTAHITVCKAPKGKSKQHCVIPKEVWQKIKEYEKKKASLGKQPLNQLLFCVKRTKEEITPPIVYTIHA